MKSAEIKDLSTKDLAERIETEKAQLAKLKVQHAGFIIRTRDNLFISR